MEVSDEVVIMNRGRVEQVGTPSEIYDTPATPFVMSFIGPVNVLPSHAAIFKGIKLQAEQSEVFLRPHDILIQNSPDASTVRATVERLIHLGREVQAQLVLEDQQILNVLLSRERFDKLDLTLQEKVYVKPKDAKWFNFQPVLEA